MWESQVGSRTGHRREERHLKMGSTGWVVQQVQVNQAAQNPTRRASFHANPVVSSIREGKHTYPSLDLTILPQSSQLGNKYGWPWEPLRVFSTLVLCSVCSNFLTGYLNPMPAFLSPVSGLAWRTVGQGGRKENLRFSGPTARSICLSPGRMSCFHVTRNMRVRRTRRTGSGL